MCGTAMLLVKTSVRSPTPQQTIRSEDTPETLAHLDQSSDAFTGKPLVHQRARRSGSLATPRASPSARRRNSASYLVRDTQELQNIVTGRPGRSLDRLDDGSLANRHRRVGPHDPSPVLRARAASQ